MPKTAEKSLLDALLDSWERNNTVLINLLRAIPPEQLEARAAADSPSVVEMFAHIHYVRLVFVSEDAPEFATPIPSEEWRSERNPSHLETMLRDSSTVVRNAVQGRLGSTVGFDRHYNHPVLFLQHMIWHEGYHHGQIKLALKLAGHSLGDKQIGPITWGIWIRKTAATSPQNLPGN
jgi:uncharacterized damage-inducible protein DinB